MGSVTWLLLGSSPLAPFAYRAAECEQPITKRMTTNGGILIERQPDYYYLSDYNACNWYGGLGRAAQQRGTWCITLYRELGALRTRGIDWCNEFVKLDHDGYEPFELSGLFCLEYAAKHGATDIILCGFDGYSDAKSIDYFDGKRSLRPLAAEHTRKIITPKTRTLVAKYPEVRFTLYGRPRYEICAPNWTIRAL